MKADPSALEDLIFDHLCDEHPEAVAGLPDADIRKRIRAGLARAAGHGLDTEGSATAFVSLMFLVAPDFDSHPAIRRALETPGLAPDQRMQQLFEKTDEDDWAEAAEQTRGWDAVA